MGWGFLGSIAKDVSHVADDAAHAVTHFVAKNWKTILVVGVSTVVFVAASALTGGLAGPALLALGGPILAGAAGVAAGGAASGLAAYALGQELDGGPITFTGALKAVAVSTVVSLATAGVGAAGGAVLSRTATPIVEKVVPDAVTGAVTGAVPSAVRSAAVQAVTGGPLDVGGQALENALTGKPLDQNWQQALVLGTALGPTQDPLIEGVGAHLSKAVDPEDDAPPPSEGIVGRVNAGAAAH
jgi:hypothetical protein